MTLTSKSSSQTTCVVPLPEAVAARLQSLRPSDSGQLLTPQERGEAEGLVNVAEFLTLLRLRRSE
jgi:hypothetical protein